MRRNVAGQFITAKLINKADGTPCTTGTTTVYVTGDAGTQAAGSVGSGAATHEGNGVWSYAPAQAETNYTQVDFVFVNTNAVNAGPSIYPTAYDANGRYDVGSVGGTAQTAGDLAAMITVVDDFLDTEVAAIKTKTDFLPSATAGASGGLLISGSNSGTTTFGAMTVTGALTVSDGVIITASTTNRTAFSATGNGVGRGGYFAGGASATAGLYCYGGGGSLSNGLALAGETAGLYAYGGSASGNGVYAQGGDTGGVGLFLEAQNNSNGMTVVGHGTGTGATFTGGATGSGFRVVGGSTSGNGINITTTSGHAVNLAPVGTNMHGLLVTGGNGGTSDGIKAVAGTGGVPIRGDITGNITGTITTATNLTNLPAITANWLTAAGMDATASAEIADQVWDEILSGHAIVGSTGAALSAAGGSGDPWSTALPGAYGAGTAGKIVGDNLDALISSRMATYTQPTGFLAATFPSGTIANTTNITAGTIATVSGNVNGNVGGNVTGSVGSVVGAVGSVTAAVTLPTMPTDWVTAAGLATDAAQEIADTILGRNVSGGSSTGRTVKQALHFIRNKWTVSGGVLTVYDTDDTTSSWTGAVTGTAGADPITSNDPT